MSGPTLFKPGGLVQTKWSEPQAMLDKYRPIDYIIDWFKGKIKKTSSPADRILVLKSATGSGKSTAFPAELYYAFYEDIRRGIACLQPKVATAMAIPTGEVAPVYTKEYLKKNGKSMKEPMEMGVNIGYQTGSFATNAVRGITYMTTGTIKQQLNIMPDIDFMNKYAFIIVDEAHERSIETDMVLYALKRFVERNYKNPLCPFVVITSATFDTIHFCDYMLSSIKAPARYENIIEVRGSTTHPITEIFLDYDAKNVIQAAIDTVAKIHVDSATDFLGPDPKKNISKTGADEPVLDEDKEKQFAKDTFFRDIIIFVSGKADVTAIKKGIDTLNGEHEFFQQYPVVVLTLTAKEVNEKGEEYANIFERAANQINVEIRDKKAISIKKAFRRVIISTTVGQTGLTLAGLKYTIDTGYHKAPEYNPVFGTDALILQPVSKGTHTQRKGRVGRKAPGFSYPLFTKKTYEALREDGLPDMMLREMSLQILSLIAMEVDPKNTINEELPVVMFSSNEKYVESLKYELRGKRTDLDKLLKTATINIAKIDLPDLPSIDAIHEALEKLYILGAINSNLVPTSLGFLMNKFRKVPIESVKMILSGYAWGASISDLVTIAAFMDFQKDLRPRKMEKKRLRAATKNINRFGMSEESATRIDGYSALYQSLFIADDFINNLILYFDFQKQIMKSFGEDASESMEAWCDIRGVDYQTMVSAIDLRDEVLNTLAAIGFNPYANAANSLTHVVDCYQNCSRDELLECVCRIKQCIFEGYKLNMAEWNPKIKAYITRQTHTFLQFFNPLFIGKRDIDKYGDGNPRFIIFDQITLKLNQNTGVYSPEVGGISVLDGFVSVDPTAF